MIDPSACRPSRSKPARLRADPPSLAWVRPLALVILLALLGGCDGDSDCADGELCACANTTDCYLECRDSGCNFELHDMVHAGGVCEDGCSQTCFSVTDCSLLCGDDCLSLTHDTTSSGTLCGHRCDHECHHVDRCGVEAGAEASIYCHDSTTCEIELLGPGGRVECRTVNTCRVRCSGTCEVIYSNIPGTPNLTCPPDAPRTECSNDRIVCGDC